MLSARLPSFPDGASVTLTQSPDVLVAHLAGEAVLLNLRDKSYYRLNETAARVWQLIEKGESRESIVAALVSEFEIDDARAATELDALLADLSARNLVTESAG